MIFLTATRESGYRIDTERAAGHVLFRLIDPPPGIYVRVPPLIPEWTRASVFTPEVLPLYLPIPLSKEFVPGEIFTIDVQIGDLGKSLPSHLVCLVAKLVVAQPEPVVSPRRSRWPGTDPGETAWELLKRYEEESR